MGITNLTLKRLSPHLHKGNSILVLGCQNIYTNEINGDLAHPYLESLGMIVKTVDISGCQGAEVVDLRYDAEFEQYDIVLDAGTSEHVDGGYYECCKNIHNACKVSGYIIRENPKTGNWIGHGQNYIDMEFYSKLAELCGYEILELTEEAAMGNVTDGWNVCVVLRKMYESEFISEEQFKSIGHVFSK